MKIVYRSDGCVDFTTTKAVHEGTALTPEELAEVELAYSSKSLDEYEQEECEEQEDRNLLLRFNESVRDELVRKNQAKSDEFWSDPCWTEPLFSNPI